MKRILTLAVGLGLLLPASALAYKGDTISANDTSFTAVVRNDDNKIVWSSKKEFGSKKKAQKKADKKAAEMDEEEGGVWDPCANPIAEGCD